MAKVQRFASVSRTNGDAGYESYKSHHACPFEGVNEMIKACNLQNYSIYYWDGLLFSYYEYVGDDYEADMAKMAADPTTQEWWAAVVPQMRPFGADGPWVDMEELYHLD
ncbi:L-rhamnose mutarotase [Olsenella phocaeensis]|uniref:L-rhamnose mutarotase n=1 Tax=Olsenella phocaeensis TaxID=1852385 RepID=UPI0009314336|nr:L-rhamnose mutarotase [Olsenella phocaeensis]